MGTQKGLSTAVRSGSGVELSSEEQELPEGSGGLTEGAELEGVCLRRLVAADAFSSLWLTDSLEEGVSDSCMRVIPAAHLQSPDAERRFTSELNFWRELRSEHVVDLYHCGRRGDYYFMQMRYMPEGSAAEQSDAWLESHVIEFARDLAEALSALHPRLGAHGNLKPSNVFPVRGKGVLISDFLLPLWLDELEKDGERLRTRLRHPYRAPEQQINSRDYDTRSDIYSFGLILLRCLTGKVVEGAPGTASAPWPDILRPIADRCLAPEPRNRFGDGQELLEAIRSVRTNRTTSFMAALVGDAAQGPLETDREHEAADRVAQAEAAIEKGRLHAALDLLESLPPDTPGIETLLDEVERRQEASDDLAAEAVRLAGMGKTDAAIDTIEQAESLYCDSSTVIAVREELGAPSPDAPPGDLPEPLVKALASGRYGVARPLLERALCSGTITEEVREAVREFKRGRVRKAFLDNARAARRAYRTGDRKTAREHWLEAARWLPSGPERERLRRIAVAAGRGRLRIDTETLGALAEREQATAEPAPEPAPPEQTPLAPEFPDRIHRLALLFFLAMVIVAVMVILLVLLS
ncbi:MAG: protein kinase [Candidatus Brocadiaceae bacterium]|jgi:hypothetical protein